MTAKEWQKWYDPHYNDETMRENFLKVVADLEAAEKERDEIRRLQNAAVVGWDKENARAEAAEAIVSRAREFVEECQSSHDVAFATRAAQWLTEVPNDRP